VSDFEFEFQLALMNRKLNEQVETLFMMPKDTYTFLSSRVIKEITRLGGDVRCFLPPPVTRALREKLGTVPGPHNPAFRTMPLTLNLRHLDPHPVRFQGNCSPTNSISTDWTNWCMRTVRWFTHLRPPVTSAGYCSRGAWSGVYDANAPAA
jgi:hypothetical protein